MGKTKTAFVGGVTETEMSGKDKYAEKMRKKAITEGNIEKVEQPKVGKVEEVGKVEGVPDFAKATSRQLYKGEKPSSAKASEGQRVHIAGLKGGQRIKVIGETTTDDGLPTTEEKGEATEEQNPLSPEATARRRKIKVRGKKYLRLKAKVDKTKIYSITEAIKLVRETNITKFDATLELHITTKKEGLTANVTLPHSFGKQKRIEFATDETVKKLSSGKVDFDVLLATADMMPKLVPFARLLGPRGLMPNPKNGTIIKSIEDAKKVSADSMSLKTQKGTAVIHTVAGKLSQKDDQLEENVKAIIEAVNPKMIDRVFLKSTMSPSVKIRV